MNGLLPEYAYVAARDQKPRAGSEPVLWVVLHSMEAPERDNMAESCANYFKNPPRPASVHFCADNNSVVQTANLNNTVAGAIGANRNGIHIEQAGYARQGSGEWDDEYSHAMIKNQVAPLIQKLCAMYGIPAVRLTADDLKNGRKGITDHKTCTDAFGGDHWDPGPNYPWDKLLAYLDGEDDMPLTPQDIEAIANRTKQVMGLDDGSWPGVVIPKNVTGAIADIQVKVTDTKVLADAILTEVKNLNPGGSGPISDADIQRIVDAVAARFKSGLG